MERFEQLLVEQIPRLRRYARALTGASARADDLVQDTLTRALGRRHLWLREKGVRAWLLSIMHNLYVNDVARRARRPEVPLDADAHQPPASERADGDVLIHELDRALAALPDAQREVLLLVGLEQLSYREAARVLSIPLGTVMSRLSRARDRLRELLAGPGEVTLRRVK